MNNEITDKDILVKKAYDNLFKNSNSNNNYIFIYTPPKVGSTTLVSSLRICLDKKYNIIHIHDEVMLNVLSGIKNVTINELIKYISKINKNVLVIDVYRSPIERKMSEFFEKLSSFHFNNTENNVKKYDIKRVISRFNNLFPHLSNIEHYFDKYNIENPILFDFIKKYTIQEINGIKYIKLRLMDSEIWANILSEILNEKIFIIKDYQTSDKDIYELYDLFKKEYKLPINFFEEIKKCKYLNFYLSEEERKNYLRLWGPRVIKETFVPFTNSEYQLYLKITLENQYFDSIQYEHYIDNGCFCKACSIKRKKIYLKLLKNEVINERIIHNDAVKDLLDKRKELVININKVNKEKKEKRGVDFVKIKYV